MTDFGLHWFRRDLRITDNPALRWACKRHEGRVLGIFFFDASFLARPDFSHARFGLFLQSLVSLQQDLRSRGGDLLVLDALPEVGFPQLVEALAKSKLGKPASLTFNRDYEPFARKRDASVTALMHDPLGVPVHTERDHLLIEPHEIVKNGGDKPFYQVYSPFARQWFDLLKTPEVQSRLRSQRESLQFKLTWDGVFGTQDFFRDKLDGFIQKNDPHVAVKLPKSGERAAMAQLEGFRDRIQRYESDRDIPSVDGTSRLSIYFKNGSLTVAQAIAALELESETFHGASGSNKFLKELVWREFYYHVLFHCPRVETSAFLEKYNALAWENDPDLFEAWKHGKTGYPIVDAGMRQLNQTGWMHNRVRMIVASFLTKDLLIDWRWGEKYFMEKLLDGDLAPNNGGWQWAASTGCDPQPYFRIFNPTLQSERFDPDGVYLKRYLPERKHLSGKALHAPIQPIVEHAVQKIAALQMYKKAGA